MKKKNNIQFPIWCASHIKAIDEHALLARIKGDLFNPRTEMCKIKEICYKLNLLSNSPLLAHVDDHWLRGKLQVCFISIHHTYTGYRSR